MIDPKTIRDSLPKETRKARYTHAGLWLDKYISNQKRGDNESRWQLVNEVAELPEPPEYKLCFRRWRKELEDNKVQVREVRVKGRMVVGLGSESVLEASICLHRTYGVPYIPGSALKGLTASYAHHFLGDKWKKGSAFHNTAFGTTDEAGYVTFFDALLIPGSGSGSGNEKKALAPDVITVHHKNYYQQAKAAPIESDDPNPIPFLSMTGDYLLALAAPDLEHSIKWTDIIFQILAQALETSGIGAKTSSGYGRIAFIDSPENPEMKRAKGYRREIEALRSNVAAGQLPGYYQRWQSLKLEEARILLAGAIVDKVQQQAGLVKAMAEKPWYKELQAFLAGKEGK